MSTSPDDLTRNALPSPPTTTRPDIDARIKELESQLVGLRQQRRDAHDASWLRVLARAIGPAVFATGDLVQHAAVDRDLHEAVRNLSAKQIGKRLARCEGRALEGLQVVRVGRNGSGCLWSLALTSPPLR